LLSLPNSFSPSSISHSGPSHGLFLSLCSSRCTVATITLRSCPRPALFFLPNSTNILPIFWTSPISVVISLPDWGKNLAPLFFSSFSNECLFHGSHPEGRPPTPPPPPCSDPEGEMFPFFFSRIKRIAVASWGSHFCAGPRTPLPAPPYDSLCKCRWIILKEAPVLPVVLDILTPLIFPQIRLLLLFLPPFPDTPVSRVFLLLCPWSPVVPVTRGNFLFRPPAQPLEIRRHSLLLFSKCRLHVLFAYLVASPRPFLLPFYRIKLASLSSV